MRRISGGTPAVVARAPRGMAALRGCDLTRQANCNALG
ncbi:hypothetical protein SXCC_01499 [Gluconacetobacter sp. SXCC-1]|nr:hypothetical protein SXCC_01499 [Gluconacetobacter sp. SXCC-1]